MAQPIPTETALAANIFLPEPVGPIKDARQILHEHLDHRIGLHLDQKTLAVRGCCLDDLPSLKANWSQTLP